MSALMDAAKAAAARSTRKELEAENARLRALLLDACHVFEHYDLPEHAFHYRREFLGLDEAKKIARGCGEQVSAKEGDVK